MSAVLASVPQRITDAGYAAAWKGVRLLPESAAAAAFRAFAGLTTRRGTRGVQQLRRNLSRVTGLAVGSPELDVIVREGMRSYARYWLETFRLPSMNLVETARRAHTVGTEHLDAALARGKGVVLALPHSGNWEVAGVWLIERGQPFTTVAERLKPESLFDKFVAYRQGLGMEVIPLTGGPPPIEVLKQRLRSGGVVCLVADRDLSRNGIEVDFFGEKARMPAGPSLLAATTGASVLPVHLYYQGDDWGQWIGTAVELGAGSLREKLNQGTQSLADAFAERIALYPQDWHMLQRLWLADLDGG